MTGEVLIFGATRGTGLEVARVLARHGEAFSVFARPGSDRAAVEALRPRQVLLGDVLDQEAVDRAVVAAGPLRAVVGTVGGRRGQPTPRPDFEGIRVIVDALRKLPGARPRVLLVTMVGIGDSQGTISAKVREVLAEALQLKSRAEDYLRNSGLEYVILRPGGMNSDAPTGKAIRTEDQGAMGVISRADLAQLVVDCIDDPAAANRIYHALDPSINRQGPLQRGEDLPRGPRPS